MPSKSLMAQRHQMDMKHLFALLPKRDDTTDTDVMTGSLLPAALHPRRKSTSDQGSRAVNDAAAGTPLAAAASSVSLLHPGKRSSSLCISRPWKEISTSLAEEISSHCMMSCAPPAPMLLQYADGNPTGKDQLGAAWRGGMRLPSSWGSSVPGTFISHTESPTASSCGAWSQPHQASHLQADATSSSPSAAQECTSQLTCKTEELRRPSYVGMPQPAALAGPAQGVQGLERLHRPCLSHGSCPPTDAVDAWESCTDAATSSAASLVHGDKPAAGTDADACQVFAPTPSAEDVGGHHYRREFISLGLGSDSPRTPTHPSCRSNAIPSGTINAAPYQHEAPISDACSNIGAVASSFFSDPDGSALFSICARGSRSFLARCNSSVSCRACRELERSSHDIHASVSDSFGFVDVSSNELAASPISCTSDSRLHDADFSVWPRCPTRSLLRAPRDVALPLQSSSHMPPLRLV